MFFFLIPAKKKENAPGVVHHLSAIPSSEKSENLGNFPNDFFFQNDWLTNVKCKDFKRGLPLSVHDVGFFGMTVACMHCLNRHTSLCNCNDNINEILYLYQYRRNVYLLEYLCKCTQQNYMIAKFVLLIKKKNLYCVCVRLYVQE